ncbi:MAG TPA: PD-(D/E)XK nuclease family protein [Solirubrobacteraceae bacterium]|nr:PD-(D/E)XK nuclease family protein [Solirubrobacteraceae bacterium]
MPLTIVTGPANAEKARVVLDGYRAALARGEGPILVVPTLADVERYRDELAAGGVVFGAQVVRFAWLVEEIAKRGSVRGRPLTDLARQRVAAAAIAETPLRALAASAATGGFAGALLRLVDELEEGRVTPQRLTQALRVWAGASPADVAPTDDPGRRAYADEVAGLYAAYRRRLERLHRRDKPLHAAAALDAVHETPDAWGATPVYFYGFDDLSALQRDAVETLAATGAQVTLSLAYEQGRMAFAGRATTFVELCHGDVKHTALKAREEHYAPASRAALHHLERELFELPADTLFALDEVDAGEAVTLLQGGGERAELELVAAEISRLIGEHGYEPHEIAVVLRDPAPVAPLLVEVFGELGVPVAIERRVAFGHTALGRGLVALLRCALLEASAEDLLAWLRTPGFLHRPQLADELEVAARQAGARSAAQARALWEDANWRLDALDRVVDAHRRGPDELLARLVAELATLFAAPRRRTAEVLIGSAAQDADVLVAGRRALDELAAVVALDRSLAPDPAQLAALLEQLEVRGGTRRARGCVTVSEPLALRARRVRALFACGLQEGVFPKVPGPEPFFGDTEREQIAIASGLRLRRRDDLGAERYLFYATVSRPEERLYLSWHEAGDDGEQAVASFFISDVRDLFGSGLSQRMRMRTLGEVGWAGAPPTVREGLRAAAAAGPRHGEASIAALADDGLVGELRARSTWSASAIELWASCPVKWFVERRLRPEGLTPDPELMLRGELAHRVLEATLLGLRERTGSSRLDAASLALARDVATAELERREREPHLQMSRDPRRQRALAHRLRADLLRYLEHAANDGSALEPDALEVVFGNGDEGHPALELAGGVRIGGRIDRIDTGPDGEAIVYDYKGRNAPESATWRRERKYQIALYVLAARDVLGLHPIGGLYQPLGGRDQRPRGLVLDGADPNLDTVSTDRHDRARFDAIVDGVVEDVLCAVGELRDGALEPRPQSCGWNGAGCTYPTICRCAAA